MANVSNKTFHVLHIHEAFSFPGQRNDNAWLEFDPRYTLYVLSVDRDIKIKEANDNHIDIC